MTNDSDQKFTLPYSNFSYKVHEKYIGKIDHYKYDVAMITLTEPIEFSDVSFYIFNMLIHNNQVVKRVMPVCLPSTKSSYVGEKALLAGWGLGTGDNPFTPLGQADRLHHVNMTIHSEQLCFETFTGYK